MCLFASECVALLLTLVIQCKHQQQQQAAVKAASCIFIFHRSYHTHKCRDFLFKRRYIPFWTLDLFGQPSAAAHSQNS